MEKEEITPSEWQIMEVLWACGEPLTSSESRVYHYYARKSMKVVLKTG